MWLYWKVSKIRRRTGCNRSLFGGTLAGGVICLFLVPFVVVSSEGPWLALTIVPARVC
jgi:hypothetical protein